jgi:hypothetical protein
MMREDNLPLPSRRFSTGLKRKRNQSIDIDVDDLTWMESTREAHNMELTSHDHDKMELQTVEVQKIEHHRPISIFPMTKRWGILFL